MEDSQKSARLMEAFSDTSFRKELGDKRNEIESILDDFIQWLKKKLRPEQRIFENLESRIKSVSSFQEKIVRKKYASIWEVKDDTRQNQELIASSLPDLIGFRITCFFNDDEKFIYDKLEQYYQNGKLTNTVLNFKENKTQENGHEIYKVTGVYDKKYCFELQIKSMVHNMWGEVDHKTIYKNENYDVNLHTKKEITEQLFVILKASDRQLLELFKSQNTERQLVRALFFKQTYETVKQNRSGIALAKYYEKFFAAFDSFEAKDLSQAISEYVAFTLLKSPFVKLNVGTKKSNRVENVRKIIEVNEWQYDVEMLYEITKILVDVNDYDEFLNYLTIVIEERLKPLGVEEEMAKDFCDDGDEEQEEQEPEELVFEILSGILSK